MKFVEKLKVNSMSAKLILILVIGGLAVGSIGIFSHLVEHSGSDQLIGNWEVKYGTVAGIDYLNATFNDDQTFKWIIKNADQNELIYTGTYKMAANKQVIIKLDDGKTISGGISNQVEFANGNLLYGDVALVKVKEFSAKNSADANPAAANTNPATPCH